MEHFDDEQEQISITIDQNEIPFPESDDDSFHSSVFEEFGFFKSNGLIRMEEGAGGYQVIMGLIARGRMGKDTVVAAIHFVPWSGPNGRGRSEAFKVISGEISSNRGGNANVKQTWYGGSREEICGIISHGFRRCRQSDIEDGFGVYLSPPEFVMDGVLSSAVDEYGLRHVLLCEVVLGNMEEVRASSKQFQPSSNEFDSGVDNPSTPTRFIIWEAYMNSRIFPSYIVSFRALHARGFGRVQTPPYKPTTPFVGLSVLISKLANILPHSKMALICKYHSEFSKKTISRAQLIYRLRQLAGDELLNDVIKSCTNKQLEGRSTSTYSFNRSRIGGMLQAVSPYRS